MVGVFFFNDTATTEIYTLSLHDALPNPRRVHLPWHDIPHPRQPGRLRAHTIAQARLALPDDLQDAPRDVLRRDATLQGVTKRRQHSFAGGVIRGKRPSGSRRCFTDWS